MTSTSPARSGFTPPLQIPSETNAAPRQSAASQHPTHLLPSNDVPSPRASSALGMRSLEQLDDSINASPPKRQRLLPPAFLGLLPEPEKAIERLGNTNFDDIPLMPVGSDQNVYELNKRKNILAILDNFAAQQNENEAEKAIKRLANANFEAIPLMPFDAGQNNHDLTHAQNITTAPYCLAARQDQTANTASNIQASHEIEPAFNPLPQVQRLRLENTQHSRSRRPSSNPARNQDRVPTVTLDESGEVTHVQAPITNPQVEIAAPTPNAVTVVSNNWRSLLRKPEIDGVLDLVLDITNEVNNSNKESHLHLQKCLINQLKKPFYTSALPATFEHCLDQIAERASNISIALLTKDDIKPEGVTYLTVALLEEFKISCIDKNLKRFESKSCASKLIFKRFALAYILKSLYLPTERHKYKTIKCSFNRCFLERTIKYKNLDKHDLIIMSRLFPWNSQASDLDIGIPHRYRDQLFKVMRECQTNPNPSVGNLTVSRSLEIAAKTLGNDAWYRTCELLKSLNKAHVFNYIQTNLEIREWLKTLT